MHPQGLPGLMKTKKSSDAVHRGSFYYAVFLRRPHQKPRENRIARNTRDSAVAMAVSVCAQMPPEKGMTMRMDQERSGPAGHWARIAQKKLRPASSHRWNCQMYKRKLSALAHWEAAGRRGTHSGSERTGAPAIGRTPRSEVPGGKRPRQKPRWGR